MMKSYMRIIIATMLLFGACKTQKPVVKDSVSQTPVDIVQLKTDTVVYNYPPPRNYNIPKRIFKEIENFETAFDELKAMLEGKIEPNFERAVFISENPYYNSQHNYEEFQRNIDFHLYFIKLLIKDNDKSDSIDFNVKVNQYGRFNLDDIRHMPDEKKALYKKSVANWAIFTYLTDTTNFYSVNHLPFTYASHDPFGIKDWSNSQVINLLYSQEQKGNCFALTALFKILSDRLQSDARICTAPQHIYIQHRDKKGDYYNVELATAGHPGDGTIQTLTHTTTEGIKSGIALRSFDTKQSIGLCLVNLAKSYEHKFGSKDDDFMLKCAELVLKHDKLNLNALLLKQQILDTRVTDYAKENSINDINALKSNSAISKAVYELERHLALLYQLGYRQMPFDMQEIIMTGIIPENFEDKNPTPFTTIDPKDEHRKKFTTLYGGLFQEVFVTREFEPYGHFTYQTSTNKITVIDTTAQTGFLIDPVAFAYDFGARMYDARLGRFLSVDPKTSSMPAWSPYSHCFNNPIRFVDKDGELPIIPLLLKAGAGGAADMLMQATMNYYFNPACAGDIEKSFGAVNWWQVSRSALEGGIIPWKTPGGRLGRAAATAIGDVMVNALDAGTDYTQERALQDFAVGFIGDLAGGGMGELMNKYGGKAVAQGLSRMGIDIREIRKLTGGIDGLGQLNYSTLNRKGQTADKHIMDHARNNLQKEKHGVFYGNPIETTNKAWENRASGTMVREGDMDVYFIPYQNAGYQGGYSGQGENLNYMRIVTKKNSSEIITSYPSYNGQ